MFHIFLTVRHYVTCHFKVFREVKSSISKTVGWGVVDAQDCILHNLNVNALT
jgi:hypothetical protein